MIYGFVGFGFELHSTQFIKVPNQAKKRQQVEKRFKIIDIYYGATNVILNKTSTPFSYP